MYPRDMYVPQGYVRTLGICTYTRDMYVLQGSLEYSVNKYTLEYRTQMYIQVQSLKYVHTYIQTVL